MTRLFPLMVGMALAACATLGNPTTPQQKLYVALSAYDEAVHTAADYAESPSANIGVVRAISSVVNSDEARDTVKAAQDFVACDNGTKVTGCEVFTGTTLERVSALLNSLKARLTTARKVTP